MVIRRSRPRVLAIMNAPLSCTGTLAVRAATSVGGWGGLQLALCLGMMGTSVQDRGGELARLIVAVGRRDRDAFGKLFEHFAPRIKTMMLRAGVPDQPAEDLAQDTMLAVWHKAHLFDPAGAGPSAWIYTIARNLRIDNLRRQQRMQRVEEQLTQEPEAEQSLPDVQVASSQAEERVRLALEQLSEEQLKVVTLSFFENKPHPEIAETLGIPLGTVKSRLRLAMTRLRTLLEETQ